MLYFLKFSIVPLITYYEILCFRTEKFVRNISGQDFLNLIYNEHSYV